MKAFFLFWIIGFSYLRAQTLSADSLHYWLYTKNRVANPGKELLKTFQLIPRDTVTLGSSYDSLYPAHSLTIYDFFIQNTEVTNIFYRTFIAYVLEDSAEGTWQKYMPDLSCWTQDFPEDSLEELNTLYFLHPMYSYYPVVGVSWEQSIVFAQWAEKVMKEYLASNPKIANRYRMGALRLPTEDEFEFAAGGLSLLDYPWGMGGTESIYCLNSKGKNFLANFMPGAQDYSLDGFDITAPVASFPPNAFHLYDMSGNVSEWCSDIYRENRFHDSLYSQTSGFRTQLHDHSTEIQALRVVKGGSWKDPAALLRIYSREGVFQDKKHSYIGFRLAATRQAE